MRHTDARRSAGASRHPSVQSVTSAPPSVADDQGTRMRRYLVAMGIRGICFFLAIVASGWLRWSFVVAAVVLPYIAVVLANAVGPRLGETVAPVVPAFEDRPALTGVLDERPIGTDREREPTRPDA